MKKEINHGEVGRRIKGMREVHNLTREELAEKAELSSKFVYELEKGRKGLSSDSLLKIAKTLSCSCDYLLTGARTDYGKYEKIVQLVKGFDDKDVKRMTKIIAMIKDMSANKDE